MDGTLQIFDIKERPTGEAKPPSFPTAPSSTAAGGFPVPRKRTSAFKQRRQAQSGAAPSSTERPDGGKSFQRSPQSTKDPEAAERRRIDEENQARLASMSPEEIIEAQKELFSGLDPTILQMLLRRANLDEKPKGPDVFGIPPAEMAPMSDPPDIKVEDTSKDSEPTTAPKSKSEIEPEPHEPKKPKKTAASDEDAAPPKPPRDLFPVSSPPPKLTAQTHKHDGTTHFPAAIPPPDLDPSDPDFLQNLHKKFFPSLPADPSKLAWMAPLPTEHSPADRESPYYPEQESFVVSALRFDFRGVLLAPRTSRQIPVTKGLHHHGEAPEAAGYTIPELARLVRSAVPAQRCIAYQTLGRILYRLGRGDWGTGAGGRNGDEDDLAFALWRMFREGKVLESLEEEASKEDGSAHVSARAYAIEALWLFEKGGWREKWRGL